MDYAVQVDDFLRQTERQVINCKDTEVSRRVMREKEKLPRELLCHMRLTFGLNQETGKDFFRREEGKRKTNGQDVSDSRA